MHFASDNAGPAHPEVLKAMAEANSGYAPAYGNDDLTTRVQDRLREVLNAPDAAVHLVATGTAANALALATMANPYDTVFCSPTAHIHEDECNAPEFFSGGAKLTLAGDDDLLTPDTLRDAIAAEETRGLHGPQRGPVSVTQVTERGQVHSLKNLRALTSVAAEFGLKSHMDGARFANAIAALGCDPGEMSHQAGFDALSFGASKNGCLGVEAVVLFDLELSWQFELRRKRGGHLFSKHRYLAAQMLAYLTDDLWLKSARRANANAATVRDLLISHPDIRLDYPGDANILFFTMPAVLHRAMTAAGVTYYPFSGEPAADAPGDTPVQARFVCDWSLSPAQIEQFASVLRAL